MKYPLCLFFIAVLSLETRDRNFEKLYVTVNSCIKEQCYQPISSSFLLEKGKPKDEYSSQKAHDYKKETAWCVSKNQGLGAYVYMPYHNDVSINEYKRILKKDYYSLFTIVNGFAKNQELFYSNNRVKKVLIEVQEIAYSASDNKEINVNIGGRDEGFYIADGPIPNSVHEIELADTMEEQKFRLKIIPKSKKDPYLQMDLLFKIVIKEIYPGSKYKDTCISEAAFEMVAPSKN
jgi:hypothetical protein